MNSSFCPPPRPPSGCLWPSLHAGARGGPSLPAVGRLPSRPRSHSCSLTWRRCAVPGAPAACSPSPPAPASPSCILQSGDLALPWRLPPLQHPLDPGSALLSFSGHLVFPPECCFPHVFHHPGLASSAAQLCTLVSVVLGTACWTLPWDGPAPQSRCMCLPGSAQPGSPAVFTPVPP